MSICQSSLRVSDVKLKVNLLLMNQLFWIRVQIDNYTTPPENFRTQVSQCVSSQGYHYLRRQSYLNYSSLQMKLVLICDVCNMTNAHEFQGHSRHASIGQTFLKIQYYMIFAHEARTQVAPSIIYFSQFCHELLNQVQYVQWCRTMQYLNIYLFNL